ncbi:MAG TPA: ribonuclease domain-containing protein [Desulfomonilaceae bacterium]|nr:ribonuclease domain-containing protein [Desulfomonilaceae bacterium]
MKRALFPVLAILVCVGAFVPSGSWRIADTASARSPFRQFLPASIAPIDVSRLPQEALHTLTVIKRGGPFPYPKDGVVFGNREGRLPARHRGYYREYTVKTPGSRGRGARRIIAGAGGDYYYTDDHYNTFRSIQGVRP